MTIQLSVLVWTVICFLLLLVILRNLLFRPVLRVMDQRRQKIQGAAAKKTAYEKAAKAREEMARQQEEAQALIREKQRKEELETLRMDSKKMLDAAREERLSSVEEFRSRTVAEQAQLLETLGRHTAELAAAFADSIVKE